MIKLFEFELFHLCKRIDDGCLLTMMQIAYKHQSNKIGLSLNLCYKGLMMDDYLHNVESRKVEFLVGLEAEISRRLR